MNRSDITISIRKRKLFLFLMLMLMSCDPSVNRDNISISISITKQQYLISAEIQAKIVPNPALISCFKLASSSLKGLRHEDFVSLGHFCAKIITYSLYSYTKCSCNTMKKISNEFYQRQLTIIIFVVILRT